MIRQISIILTLMAVVLPVYSQNDSRDWPVFRGISDLSGYTSYEIPATPALLWTARTGSRTSSSPVVSDGLIIFSSNAGEVIAVGTDGKSKWKYTGGVASEAPPLVFGDRVFIGFSDGTMRALDLSRGKEAWRYTTEGQIIGSANAWVTGRRSGIVFGSYDYYLHSVDPATGELLWKVETMNYVNGTPAVSNNNIVFGGCDGMLRITDAYTGKEKEAIEIGTYIAASPALSGSRACFGDYDGNFFCVDMLTAKIDWTIPASETSGSIMAIPAIGRNSVVVGDENKNVYCYDLAAGTLKWKFRANGSIKGSAVITPSNVMFGSIDGYIYVLDLQSGRKLWSFNTGAPISSSPAVAGDRFYFLTEDGRVLAFGKR
jgi:outer membrane protein assembly factor BamB